MTRQTSMRRLLTLFCALGSLALVGATPAVADELPADGGPGDACTERAADAYEAIDAFEASLPADGTMTETELIGPFQAIVSQLNADLERMDCSADDPD